MNFDWNSEIGGVCVSVCVCGDDNRVIVRDFVGCVYMSFSLLGFVGCH